MQLPASFLCLLAWVVVPSATSYLLSPHCSRLAARPTGDTLRIGYTSLNPALHESSKSSTDKLRQEAEEMMAKARALRNELPPAPVVSNQESSSSQKTATRKQSPWNAMPAGDDDSSEEGLDYRLYVDIGREEGTWMDPRWGASGKRIEFTLDVRFLTDTLADPEISSKMVKDNFGGKSSAVYGLRSATKARLRQGFDSMKCVENGAYRIDMAKGSVGTMRFYVSVDGTSKESSYGDVSVPPGALYFSLPAFGGKVSQLSQKEGPVTVRQIGWHTGFRREESRIVGIFKAVPLADARRRDGF